jgi:hypothetical protein
MVPLAGIEPARPVKWARDFKSLVSTISPQRQGINLKEKNNTSIVV